jgi:ferredoxin-NADP reductase/MOSC domain-containing protein YiiM
MQMARLLSVNIGMPKNVSWHGKTVHTGIWKTSAAGPRMVRARNLDGDGQGDLAGHGGEQRAVLVYQVESLAYWYEYLGREGSRSGSGLGSGGAEGGFGFGAFGENFTVEGLADDEVCIGDRYRIGEAEFEVTQPRVTCYRLGMRLDTPTLPSLLVAHGRPGFYLRVLTEGMVQAGDEIICTRRGPHELTVADIDALLYLPNRDREKLQAAVDIPALSPGWRQSFQDLLERGVGEDGGSSSSSSSMAASESVSASVPGIGVGSGWRGLRPLRVEAVVPESSTIMSVYLAAEDGSALPAALPGQYLTLRVPEAGDPAPIRSYSLSSAPGSGAYRISVKLEGLVSGYVHTKLCVGASIQAVVPRGEFVLVPGAEPVLLISAGVGVTPVLAMLHELAAECSEREVWWLHTARDAEQQAFAREAHGLLSTLPAAHELVFHTASDGVRSDGGFAESPGGGSGVLAEGSAGAPSGGGDDRASGCWATEGLAEERDAASSGRRDGPWGCGVPGGLAGGRDAASAGGGDGVSDGGAAGVLSGGRAGGSDDAGGGAWDGNGVSAALPVSVRRGRLSAGVLSGLGLPSSASAYICGPERFMTDMTVALVGLGLDRGSVHTELFGALAPINPGVTEIVRVPPHPPVGEPGDGPLVTFARSGLTVPWDADAAPSLLEFAEACDVPTRWACRAGVCHTCVTALIAGEAAYRPDPLELPAPGQVLVCCARPTSDLVLDL